MEVLRFIARYGVVARQAIAAWAGTKRTVTQRRERRLRLAGLIEVEQRFASLGPFCIATRRGLRACARAELRPARLSWGEVIHQTQCVLVGGALERVGHRVLSEREIMAAERLREKRLYSARFGDSFHRPDLVRVEGDQIEAIEVELTPKGASRLDAVLRAWRRAVVQRRVSGVLYLCSPATIRGVEHSVRRTSTESQVRVQPLASLHELTRGRFTADQDAPLLRRRVGDRGSLVH